MHYKIFINNGNKSSVLQPASGYHSPAKPQCNTNTHRTRAIQPMEYLNK